MRVKAQSASTKGLRKQEVKKLRYLFELLSGILSSASRYGSRLVASHMVDQEDAEDG